MKSFRVRHGYGPDARPLIEFLSTDNASIKAQLTPLFKQLGIKSIAVETLWQNDEVIEKFKWRGQLFEVSYSTWDIQFIQEIGQSDIIQDIAKALNTNPNFNQI